MNRLAALLALLAGCAAPPPPEAPTTSEAPPVRASEPPPEPRAPPWCPAVKGLTDDASTDQTGRTTNLARLKTVQSAHQWELLQCPGVNGVGITIVAFAEGHFEGAGTPVPPEALEYVLKVNVRRAELLPKTSPLYLDGVRVYFQVADIQPL